MPIKSLNCETCCSIKGNLAVPVLQELMTEVQAGGSSLAVSHTTGQALEEDEGRET